MNFCYKFTKFRKTSENQILKPARSASRNFFADTSIKGTVFKGLNKTRFALKILNFIFQFLMFKAVNIGIFNVLSKFNKSLDRELNQQIN